MYLFFCKFYSHLAYYRIVLPIRESSHLTLVTILLGRCYISPIIQVENLKLACLRTWQDCSSRRAWVPLSPLWDPSQWGLHLHSVLWPRSSVTSRGQSQPRWSWRGTDLRRLESSVDFSHLHTEVGLGPSFKLFRVSSFPGGSEDKVSACNAGDPGSIPGLGKSPGEGNGDPFQYSCLENPMDRGAWRATVHGVSKSWTRLNDFTFDTGNAPYWPKVKFLSLFPMCSF